MIDAEVKPAVWWYQDYENITSLDNVNFEQPSVLIQDLVGEIQNLQGNIEDLGPEEIPTQSLWFGKSNGDILIENQGVTTGFTTIITSKTWTSGNGYKFYIQRLQFTYQVVSVGSFLIQYSKDNQVNWTTFKTVTLSAADLGKRPAATYSKAIYARQFNWRIIATEGSFELVDFNAFILPGGYSTTR